MIPYLSAIRSNMGKARALSVGFRNAKGDIIFTMDADLQDDPHEIPQFLKKLDEGYDIISGYKKIRHDPWHKVLPSRVFNKILSTISGVHLHDHNCGFKCYRAEVVHTLELYGEMHRMIPVISSIDGFKSAEVIIKHHPRMFGVSKYGFRRFLSGFLDMHTVYFLKTYSEKPLHLLGGLTLFFGGLGILLLSLALGGIFTELSGGAKAGLFIIGFGFLATCPYYMAIGLIAELIVSGRIGSEKRPIEGTPDDIFSESDQIIQTQTFSSKRGNVLVQSQDPKIAQEISSHLPLKYFEVIDIENDLSKIEKYKDEQNLILIDTNEINDQSLQFIRKTKIQCPKEPLVVLSSTQDPKAIVECMKLGVLNYIPKPIDKDHLTTAIGTILQKRDS